jgi:hypothetical protein
VFDYRTVGTMVDDTAKEVDRIMKKLNRLQFDLQNKKAALSQDLSRAHNISREKYWPFSVSSNQLGIQEQLEFLDSQMNISNKYINGTPNPSS